MNFRKSFFKPVCRRCRSALIQFCKEFGGMALKKCQTACFGESSVIYCVVSLFLTTAWSMNEICIRLHAFQPVLFIRSSLFINYLDGASDIVLTLYLALLFSSSFNVSSSNWSIIVMPSKNLFFTAGSSSSLSVQYTRLAGIDVVFTSPSVFAFSWTAWSYASKFLRKK